jgi:hypothetical protein
MERSSERFFHAACVRVVMEWGWRPGWSDRHPCHHTIQSAEETHKHGHSYHHLTRICSRCGCGLMTFVGAVGHTLPFLIPVFVTAALIVGGVVLVELLLIAWIRHRYMDTPLLAATFQVIVGGVIVFGAGMLIGSS